MINLTASGCSWEESILILTGEVIGGVDVGRYQDTLRFFMFNEGT
jgi:hypothetical protein